MKQEFVDLGLPSGTLWAKHNVQIRNRKHFTHFEIPLLEDITGHNVPSEKDFEELLEECVWKWTIVGRTRGYRVTGPNGKSIFLSTAGLSSGGFLYGVGYIGYYWSTRHYSSSTAYHLRFDGSSKNVYYTSILCRFSVRLIKHKNI